jgi:hypothetical protein
MEREDIGVIANIDVNRGFRSFGQTTLGKVFLVCEAEPIRPDLRRSTTGTLRKYPEEMIYRMGRAGAIPVRETVLSGRA